MGELIVGYCRCSTDAQDLAAQREALLRLGVAPERIYLDHGLTGTNRARSGLREALARYVPGTSWLSPNSIDSPALSPTPGP
jgi:DNA invertase Pin-like site-specific DNA recombinase